MGIVIVINLNLPISVVDSLIFKKYQTRRENEDFKKKEGGVLCIDFDVFYMPQCS